MAKNEKGFCMFYDWVEDLDQLEGAEAWKIVKALSNYHRFGTDPLGDFEKGPTRVVMSMMMHQVKRKEAISEARSAAGRHGGVATANRSKARKKKNLPKQKTATETETETETKTETETVSLRSPRTPAHEYGEFKNVFLTDKEHAELIERYGDNAEKLINNFSRKLKAKGYEYDDHYAALLSWAESDGVTKSEKSYDTDDFFEAALRRSYGEFDEKYGETK